MSTQRDDAPCQDVRHAAAIEYAEANEAVERLREIKRAGDALMASPGGSDGEYRIHAQRYDDVIRELVAAEDRSKQARAAWRALGVG